MRPAAVAGSVVTTAAHQPVAAAPLTVEEFCALHADRVYRFATMIARDTAEADDLAQAALERLLRALPRFDPERGELGAWLWRIVVNTARDAGRADRRHRLLLDRLASLRTERSTAADIPVGVTDERLLDAIRGLTPRQRTVVALRFGADLEHADVGAALGISAVAARNAAHRAITTLRRHLEDRP